MKDVVIVGAGPAGSSAALRLARAGYDVTLLERSRFPRTKVCGDYVSAGGVSLLRELDVAGSVLEGAYPIWTIALHGFGEHLRLSLPQHALALPRSVLDERLRQAALHAGARLFHGSFLRARSEPGAMNVHVRDAHGQETTIATRVLLGADGAWSSVAQRCGLSPVRRLFGRWAVGGHLYAQRTSHELEMYVGTDGYYARNPLGATIANSMLVLPKPVKCDRADAIVARISDGERRFEPEKIERMVAIGPLAYRASGIMRGRLLLTGDAAELLDPFIGQGVTTALALSQPVANAIAALLAGDREARVAREYRAAWRGIVGPRRALGAFVSSIVRIDFIRQRVLSRLRGDSSLLHQLLASVSGLTPEQAALTPRTLWRLLVA